MRNWIARVLFIFLCTSLSSVVLAKTVTVGVGNFKPFFDEEYETGLFLELTREVFKNMPGYEPQFVYMSNARLLVEIESGRIDAASNIFQMSVKKSFLTEPLFRYTDVGVSLKKNNLKINKVSDLKGLSISAYQGATDLLGEDFKNIVKDNPKYREHPIPLTTTKKMVRGNYDVRIGDVFIFLHDLKVLQKTKKLNLKVSDFKIHYLWKDVFSSMAFRTKKDRDLANKAIRKLKKNGTIDEIYKRYERVFTQKKMLPKRP